MWSRWKWVARRTSRRPMPCFWERNRYDLMRWTKAMNISSLRQRLYYHGKEIVLGGDMYCA